MASNGSPASAHKNVYRNYGQMIGNTQSYPPRPDVVFLIRSSRTGFACQSIGVGILLGIAFYQLDEVGIFFGLVCGASLIGLTS